MILIVNLYMVMVVYNKNQANSFNQNGLIIIKIIKFKLIVI